MVILLMARRDHRKSPTGVVSLVVPVIGDLAHFAAGQRWPRREVGQPLPTGKLVVMAEAAT